MRIKSWWCCWWWSVEEISPSLLLCSANNSLWKWSKYICQLLILWVQKRQCNSAWVWIWYFEKLWRLQFLLGKWKAGSCLGSWSTSCCEKSSFFPHCAYFLFSGGWTFQGNVPQKQQAEPFTVKCQLKYNYCLELIELSISVESRVCILQ